MASIGSERGLAGACAYNATKHAVVGLTRTAASEVAQKGVRVNCVMPGVIETPLLLEVIEQLFPGNVQKGLEKLGQVATLNRLGKPEEVGNVVSFLLSDEASYVNGAKWEIDGGALATIRNDI
jgi:NAD(P)-dependent dehydrogenase (short-subunit alcohol dehydrogenase family)